MKVYITDESVYKLCWAPDHPANLFRNPYKLFIGVYSAQIASNCKYLNINESGSLELMQWAILIKLQIDRKIQFYFHHVIFFHFIVNKIFSYKWQQIPIIGEGKEWIIDLHRWDLFQRLIHLDTFENAKL